MIDRMINYFTYSMLFLWLALVAGRVLHFYDMGFEYLVLFGMAVLFLHIKMGVGIEKVQINNGLQPEDLEQMVEMMKGRVRNRNKKLPPKKRGPSQNSPRLKNEVVKR